MERDPELIAKIRARVEAGICIREGCGGAIRSRGLCQRCKNEFYNNLGELKSPEAKLAFEEKLIEECLLLYLYEQQRWQRSPREIDDALAEARAIDARRA
ncbi:MAG: hypothetical protein AAFP90_17725 [Planctomycetota bacterium]